MQQKIGGRLRAREGRIVRVHWRRWVNPWEVVPRLGLRRRPVCFNAGNSCKLFAKPLGKKRDLNPHSMKVLQRNGYEPLKMMKNQKTKEPLKMGFYLVVSARIYGHKVRALIDSGFTRCFISSGTVLPLGLKSTSENTLLELGNGDRILSRGRVNDVPVVEMCQARNGKKQERERNGKGTRFFLSRSPIFGHPFFSRFWPKS